MWVARDKGYLNCDNDIIQDCVHLFWNKPKRAAGWLWVGNRAGDKDIAYLFPNLKWEDEPIEVRLTTDENNQAIYDTGYNDGMNTNTWISDTNTCVSDTNPWISVKYISVPLPGSSYQILVTDGTNHSVISVAKFLDSVDKPYNTWTHWMKIPKIVY